MDLREGLIRRARGFARYEESTPPSPPRSLSSCLRDIDAIRQWLPRQARLADPDPAKEGIRRMRAALACLTERPR